MIELTLGIELRSKDTGTIKVLRSKSLGNNNLREMLTFEFENPSSSTCECCGGITTRLTRFVYRDDDTYAIYYAMFSDDHSDRIVKMVISLGDWAEDSDPNQRRAFALDLRVTDERYEVMVTDASDCPWHKAIVLGRIHA